MAVGDKDGLLVSVFGDWVAAAHQARGEPEAFGGSPEEAADAIMGVFAPFLAYFARNPQLSRDYTSIIARGTHTLEIFGDLAVTLVAELGANLDYDYLLVAIGSTVRAPAGTLPVGTWEATVASCTGRTTRRECGHHRPEAV